MRDFANKQNFGLAKTSQLLVITEELVTNVIDYAVMECEIVLMLHLDQSADGIRMTIEDNSISFDPRTVTLRELPNLERGGGVGLALVRAWTDIVAYSRENGRNRLVLRLHQDPTTPL